MIASGANVRVGTEEPLSRRRPRGWCALPPLLLLLGLGACVPTQSVVSPPYEIDGRAYNEAEIQVLARDRCSATHPRAGLPPYAFTTDGCSAWPDGAWVGCCIEHDIAYWCGGPRTARLAADRRLRECVRGKSAPTNGALMYYGVRLGGHPLWPFPWRWGYGHAWPFDLCVYAGGDVCPPQPEMLPPFEGR